MFYGGTNFGFLGGANVQGDAPWITGDTTSYGIPSRLNSDGGILKQFHLRVCSSFQLNSC